MEMGAAKHAHHAVLAIRRVSIAYLLPDKSRHILGMFSDTRGMVQVSSGESNPFSAIGNNQLGPGDDVFTGDFSYGSTHLQFSGNIGYALKLHAGGRVPVAQFQQK